MAQETQTGALYQPRGVGWGGRWEGGSKGRGYIYTMDYYSAIKWNASESFLMRWMNLEPIIHSDVSQKEKNKYCVLTHIYGL